MASTTVTLLTFCFALPLLMQYTYGAIPSLHHRQPPKTWCVAKPSTTEIALKDILEFACSESDCSSIRGNGSCLNPNTLLSHASVAMNVYYQSKGRNPWNCYFNGTGLTTITDPSSGNCKYV